MFVLTSFTLFVGSMWGTSVRAPDFETLVDRAELIFTGRVVSQRSEWSTSNGQKSIVTHVSLSIEKLHKGKAGSVVTLQFLGGSVGDVTMEVAEIPRFANGERTVLFIENNGVAASPVIGFFHGKFLLRKDRNGRDAMLKHSGEPLGDVAEIGRARRAGPVRAASRAMLHEEFSTKIRDRLALAPDR